MAKEELHFFLNSTEKQDWKSWNLQLFWNLATITPDFRNEGLIKMI